MSRYTELLGLPEDDVLQGLADAYEGYSFALNDYQPSEEALPWQASSKLLAAVFQVLVKPLDARMLFRNAALAYRSLESNYWKLLAVCASEAGLFPQEANTSDESTVPEPRSEQLFFELIRQCLLSHPAEHDNRRNNLDSVLNSARSFQAYRVGHLQIPLRIYVDVITDSLEWGGDTPRLENWQTLLNRAYESVELAQQDRYHWSHLYGAVVPLEPEILATSVALTTALFRFRGYDQAGIDIREMANRLIGRQGALVPVEIAFELVTGQKF